MTSEPALDDADTLKPLSRDRVEAQMKALGFKYHIDSDGDIGARWDGVDMWFMIKGDDEEVLNIQGRSMNIHAPEDRFELLEFINDWSSRTFWPKVFLRTEDDGMIRVYTEVNTDLEYGVTDQQLNQLMCCGIGTTNVVIDECVEKIPAQGGR